jgi:hypothetical protein
MTMRAILTFALGLAAVALSSCASAPATDASVGQEELYQTAAYRKLFSREEGFHDLVLATHDFRDPAFSWERTAIVAFNRGRTIVHEFVSVDRKKMGQDRVRHMIATFWPVSLQNDPANLQLLLAEATAEFAVPAGEASGEKGAQGGILSLDVKLHVLGIERNGDFKLTDPALGDAAKGIAAAVNPGEGKTPPPLYWRLLLDFYLAERNREGGNTARAASGYQSIIDTSAHAVQLSEEDLVHAADDVRDVGCIAAMAKSRLEAMK